MTKSISRFRRNTVDTLDAIRRLKSINVDVIFASEEIRLSDNDSEFYITALEAAAQEESRVKSETIKWGLQKSLKSGNSKLYARKCFGYKHNTEGSLVIVEEQAKIVRLIYSYYLDGHSIVSIIKELKSQNIKSPTGKDNWSKRAIETILSNEKYIGQVLVGKTYGGEFPNNKRYLNKGERNQFLASNTHDAIISSEIFEKVTVERQRRSNVEIIHGKSTHYRPSISTVDMFPTTTAL
jgi:site-specific DNA recombinase